MSPTSSGPDNDPKTNPAVDPNLPKMGCDKVLVCVAENDSLRSRGEAYYTTLINSDQAGQVEFYETKGQDHCFHLYEENSEKDALMKKLVNFIDGA
uniref:Alpha/beta hydrolase fold-3 domain-containing protein n=1 Tax=Rhizophora mucronata TaxID=61149 RepID=A0A2P2P5R7_RHIMU